MRTMKLGILTLILAIVAVGCEDTINTLSPDDLAPPLGLTSITGDAAVVLSWQASNYGEGRQGFKVFMADGNREGTAPETVPTVYDSVGTLSVSQAAGTYTATVTGLSNGSTYSFLVVAFKDNGNKISRPSNIVSDTPRIDFNDIVLVNGGSSRYLDVAANPPVPSGSATNADVLCQSFDAGAGPRHGLVGVGGARVQDLGYVATWDEVDAAPVGLSSYPDDAFSVQVLENHCYAVYTTDNHYAKIWVTAIHLSDFGFDCRVAYQAQAGNPELKPGDARP